MAKTLLGYFPIGTVSGVLVAAWLSLVFSSLVSLRVLIGIVRHGAKYFEVRDRTGPNRPKVLDQYGAHRFVQLKKQNIKLHYVEAGSPDKQLMLLVHGFPECWFSWRHQIEAFKGSYHTVAVNMRGYGESDKPRGVANYQFDILVADLVELIETLTAGKKQAKIILVAHDWGGVLAWSLAHQRPDLVGRFVALNAPDPRAWNARIETTWRQFFSSWYMFFFNFPFLAEILFRGNDFAFFDTLFGKYFSKPGEEECTAVYKHYYAQPYGITGPLNYYRARLRGYGAEKARKAAEVAGQSKVEPKTVVIWGREDRALIEELATDSAALCRDATVEYVEKCSHWIQVERPQEVNEIMRQFLSVK